MDNNQQRTLLLKMKSELEDLRAISLEARKPVVLDQASVGRISRMDAMQMQAMAKASERKREITIKRIETALQRLAEGEYGFCEICGDEIAPRRLEVDPAASICINCASGKS